ncbi:MAG TPA: acetate/propionate family kinase [Kofleriaceae bacterium]|nr:acetate/propionate family kinase [Kofleriaceae bacterium]
MNVLVLNAGSSSVKYDLYDLPAGAGGAVPAGAVPAGTRVVGGTIDRLDGADAVDAAIHRVFDELGERTRRLAAVGHRVVHGGAKLVRPVVIDDAVLAAIDACSAFAPLHNPLNLRGIRAARARFPALPHVAVFDTAFHATIPAHAVLYGLPYELYLEHGFRRFGFHGPSHQYMAVRAAAHLGGDATRLRLITCHLGGGASVAAIAGGASIDTSMGLTPLEGLVMATRPGDLDPAIPGLLLARGYSPERLADLLNHHAGLAGLSGLGADVRDIEAAADRGHARARLALEVFVHRIRKYLGGYAVELGGVDALVFAGGIGEGSAQIRARVCAGLALLGLALDPDRNAGVRLEATGGLAEISVPGAAARILVVHTEEERMIARDVVACLAGGEPS